MLITAIFDPKKAWEIFRKEVLTAKGGVFFLLLVACGFVVHYLDSCNLKSDSSKIASVANPVQSPVMQASGTGAATQNNDYSQKSFSGNVIEENRGTVNYFNTQNLYQSIVTNVTVLITNTTVLADPILFTWSESFGALEMDTLSSFTNAALKTHSYNDALKKSVDLIGMLETCPPNITSALRLQQKAAIYSMAAFSADMTDTNQEAAYEYALKAYNLIQGENTVFMLAVTAHNLGRKVLFGNGDSSRALELIRKAIGIYEANPEPLNSGMPTNFLSAWYFNAALAADKIGLLDDARQYAVKAFVANNSQKSAAILMKTFRDSGLNIAVLFAATNPATQPPVNIFIYGTNGQIVEWNGFSK